VEVIWKRENREKMEEDVKLSVSSMEGMTRLEEGNWKRGRFYALSVGQGKRSHGGTGE